MKKIFIRKRSIKNSDTELKPKSVAIKITSVYIVLGVLWILFSDRGIYKLISPMKTLTTVSMIKGSIYIFISGVALYGISLYALNRIKSTEDELMESYQKLSQTHEELERAYNNLALSKKELNKRFDELLRNQELLKTSEERYRLVIEASNDGIWDWDIQNGETYHSNRWYEVIGHTKKELEGKDSWDQFIHPEDRNTAIEAVERHLQGETNSYRSEFRVIDNNDNCKWILANGKALFNEKGEAYRMIGSYADITDLKNYENQLKHLAYHDALTGLPNRLYLSEILSEFFKSKEVSKIAIIFIDLDNFKFVNDTLGHEAGDQLIVEVGKRLCEILGENNKVFRLGGDEFISYSDDFTSKDEVGKLAKKLIDAFKKQFEIFSSALNVFMSVGIALYPDDGEAVQELLRYADLAMYEAKKRGKNNYVFYSKELNSAALEKMNIGKFIRTALDRNEFTLYYQPQLSIKNNKIYGFEALIRWNSPELGVVPTNKLIEIAEENLIIIQLGQWVLETACSFIKQLHKKGYKDCIISVNVSVLQLFQEDFLEMVMKTLEVCELSPEFLELEITESVLIESFDMIIEKVKVFKRLGVRIALDDFGKGYSSLSYLIQLPIDTLKIDKSFMEDISNENNGRTLIGTIIEMAHKMEMSVVAEGVETYEQFQYLKVHGCDVAQGYFISNPLPAKDVESLNCFNDNI